MADLRPTFVFVSTKFNEKPASGFLTPRIPLRLTVLSYDTLHSNRLLLMNCNTNILNRA